MDPAQWPLAVTSHLPAYAHPTEPVPPDHAQRFVCDFPGCNKKFSRREHLTRHGKSHDPHARYRCPICGRRYARSDVLKRHVKFHPALENKPASEGTSSCLDEAMAEPDMTTIVQNAAGSGNTEATDTHLAHTWEQLTHDLWPFTPPSSDSRQQAGAVIPNQFSQIHLDQDTGLHYGEAYRGPPSLIVASLDGNDENTSTSANSTPLQDWDLAESAPTSLASSVFQDHDHTLGALDGLEKASPSRQQDIEIYFSRVHPFWPILHAPTFCIGQCSNLLLASIALLASWLQGDSDHCQSCHEVFEAVTTSELLSNPSLDALQALFLCVVYASNRLGEPGMTAWVIRLNTILISTCRAAGVFSDERELPQQRKDSPLAIWLSREHLRRLAFSVLRIDTYLSLILDHPPSLRYEEMLIPLPRSARLWEAASDADRRRLQWEEPAGRDNALFSYLMRDIIYGETLPCRLTKHDYHMALLGLQSGVWEAAREAHSFAVDALDIKVTPGVPFQAWRARLEKWRDDMEEDCTVHTDYFSDAPCHSDNTDKTDLLSPVTLLAYHIASAKLHAPLDILHVSRNSYLKPTRHVGRSPENAQSRLGVWFSSSCPRIAVWNAAMIARIASRELRTGHSGAGPVRLLNPLIVPGLLMASVVAYSYVRNTVACASCVHAAGGQQHESLPQEACLPTLRLDGVDNPHDPTFVAWRDSGKGLATFGVESIPLCKCKTAEITDLFERLLSTDSIATNEFLAFVRANSVSRTEDCREAVANCREPVISC